MTKPVTIYDLAASPHNMKVRIAAAVKDIPHSVIEVKSEDRAPIIALTGQPRTPVIQHGDVKLFGSGAILRYFDANFKGPQLYTSDYAGMREIENWERFSENELGPCVSKVFGQIFAEKKDPKECELASDMLHKCSQKLEEHLGSGKTWLYGDRISAADIFCAPFVWYGMVPKEHAHAGTPAAFFHQHLKLGPGRERTREWCSKVMRHRWKN
jgi:glutathione S-transferase